MNGPSVAKPSTFAEPTADEMEDRREFTRMGREGGIYHGGQEVTEREIELQAR